MALRKRKPTSPGRRFQTVSDFSEITKDRAREVAARAQARAPAAATAYGRKTARHRGGGHKQQYRIIDFKRNKDGVPAKVAAIEYDPNRNCRIALLHYLDGEKRYILAPNGVKVGDLLQSGQGSEIRPGNALPLRYIPVGTIGAQRRAQAGRRRQDGPLAPARACSSWPRRATSPPCACPSTEMRRVPIDCRATVGEVGNAEAELIKIGKAGRNRWKGVAPADPRRRHEPRRPPPRWWRGQDLRWSPPGVAVGQARGPHPRQDQAVPEAHRPPPPHRAARRR